MTIEEIIRSEEDNEIKKYQILSALKYHEARLRKNLLYPSLTELVNSLVKMEMIVSKALINYDDQNVDDIFTGMVLPEFQIEEEEDELTELVKWSMHHINKILDEGIALFEFAENNIKIGQISGQENNKEEGYLIIPNLEQKQANVYSFETVVFSNASIPVTSIKTKLLVSFSEKDLLNKSSEPAIKILMDYINDKGATIFFCTTDVELPFEETVLPVAKKNLLKYLSE